MDNDMSATEGPTTDVPVPSADAGRGLPRGASFPASATAPSPPAVIPSEPDERTGVFRHLVTDDTDIAGLVAYSIYKQNKLDWLTAFEKARGRVPNGDELAAYIIGEETPRRIATYRHLAEATLAGNGPDIGGLGKTPRAGLRRAAGGGVGERKTLTTGLVAAYALVAALFLVGFLLAAHYTMSSR